MGKLKREFDAKVVDDFDLTDLIRVQQLIAALHSMQDRQHRRQRQRALCRLVLTS